MVTLTDEERAVIREKPIGRSLDQCRDDFRTKFASSHTPALSTFISSATGDTAPRECIGDVLHCLAGLPAARKLPSRNAPSKYLHSDIADLMPGFEDTKRLNMEAAAQIFKILAGDWNDELIWSTVYDLVNHPKTPPRGKRSLPAASDPFLRDLHNDWHRAYLRDSLHGLRQQMLDCLDDRSPYYAKTLVFVQSSGMGKSRLADMFGKVCPMINYILREQGDGYPPTDDEILSFLRQPLSGEDYQTIFISPSKAGHVTPDEFATRRISAIWNHSVAVGLLQASLEICEFRELLALLSCGTHQLKGPPVNAWVESQDPSKTSILELAVIRHELMAVLDPNAKVAGVLGGRSQERIKFCKAVVGEAGKLARKLAMDQQWRECFNDEGASAVHHRVAGSNLIKPLLDAAQKLMDDFEKFPGRSTADPSLVIVIDEASSLFTTPGSPKMSAGRYVALNRIFSVLKEFPIWFFILSTESKVENLLPPDRFTQVDEDEVADYSNVPSSRRALLDPEPQLRLFPPFVAFRLDVEDRSRMRDPELRAIELAKPMAQFSQPKHMAMFGRPLWFAYDDPHKMNKVAKSKLIGGGKGATFNPNNTDHVFAALSFRLSLDVCLENPITLPIVRNAVNSHLRVVISMNQPTGVLRTFTPSEPVLAKAAMEILCDGQNWSVSIGTFARQLIQRGVIEKGLKGELYTRLVLILAHDWIRWGAALRARALPKFAPTFTVDEFLKSLYASEHHKSIQKIASQIREARMNFTHFVPTGEYLSCSVIPELCHDLLRRGAALQLAHGQPTYDKLIPIYFGREGERFDPSQCGVILIQDKNKTVATTISSIFKEGFTTINETDNPSQKNLGKPLREGPYFIFEEMVMPILFLMFDMGISPVRSQPVEVSYSNKDTPRVWAIHSRGHSKEIFGCLDHMDRVGECEAFFSSAVEASGIYADIARENMAFGELAREFRYARIEGTVGRGQDTGGGDEDTQMEGA